MMIQGIYHIMMLTIDGLLLKQIRKSCNTTVIHFLFLAGFGAFSAVFLAAFLTWVEGRISAEFVLVGLAWHGSFFLFVSAFFIFRQRNKHGQAKRFLPVLIFLFGIFYAGIALDALFIEPNRLVVRKMTLSTSKISKPITIVFCTDIQTDHVGTYEQKALQTIKEQHADLILFGGDYCQGKTQKETQQLWQDLNQLFRDVSLHAPLGVYAIHGNIGSMKEMFENTSVILKATTVTEQLGEIRVTFLSFDDSARMSTVAGNNSDQQFRIMVGHMPRYAVTSQEADLLLAGHTHGGQVQIPFWGPLFTATGIDFPRRWASGMTVLPDGNKLIVSHGVGHERDRAPRVRFCCLPDIWVIRLKPEPHRKR